MQLVDRLVQLSDKEELAECARLMAMNIAHYEMGIAYARSFSDDLR